MFVIWAFFCGLATTKNPQSEKGLRADFCGNRLFLGGFGLLLCLLLCWLGHKPSGATATNSRLDDFQLLKAFAVRCLEVLANLDGAAVKNEGALVVLGSNK